MKLSTSLTLLLLTSGLSASSLSVYQDQSLYSYKQKSTYIGFIKGVQAKCDGENTALSVMTLCPENEKLCKELRSIEESQKKLNTIQYNGEILDTMIKLPQPTEFDANAWIKSAKHLGEEKANLLFEEKKMKELLQIKRSAFQKKVSSQKPLKTEIFCKNELELTLNRRHITFSTSYEANIDNKKEIKVTQYLKLLNRSGIDIEADTASFYYRAARQYVRPVNFRPWIVSEYKESVRRHKAKKTMQNIASDAPMRTLAMTASEEVIPRVSYVDAREYKIEHLKLPSTGLPLDVEVLSWKSPLNCEIKAYPYVNTKAFQLCSFTPKYQIDSHQWKIKEGSDIFNENAQGEYKKGQYTLYTKVEDDIKIQRKQIVNKERETGIFGGTERKKDGFVLTVTNKSNKAKTLTLVDRIPTSATDKIEVKLLNVKANKKVHYKMLKDGKMEMKLTLDAQESRKIEVLFEISYDKDLKVSY